MMGKTPRARVVAVTSTAIALVLAASAPASSAQTLMELFFGDRPSRSQERSVSEPIYRESPAPQPTRETAPAPRTAPPRITGPSYYTYRTDALVPVDVAAIAAALDERSSALPLDTGSVGSTTVEAPEPETQLAEARRLATETADDGAAIIDVAGGDVAESDAEETLPQAGLPAGAAADESLTTGEPGLPLSPDALAGLAASELLAEKEAAEAIVAHYSASPSHVWVEADAPSARAQAAIEVLAGAAAHALNPSDYAVATPRPGATGAELARFEMELSARVLRYMRDARSGRVDPNRISGYHDFAAKPFDAVAALQMLRTSDDVAGLMEAQHPANRYYAALRDELASLRASEENAIVIAPGTLIRPGQSNSEFAKILTLIETEMDAAYLAVHGEALRSHAGGDTYAQALVPAIKAAQAARGLSDDGIIGPRTIQALAGDSRASRIERVKIAMEQVRWLPADPGDRYVFLNTPSFTAAYFEGGEQKLSMRAIYGNTSTQTYFFQDEVSYVEFHPFWGVPRSILVNRYLPKLLDDPSYLDRSGFEVVNSRGQVVPSSSVAWGQYGANIPFDVRQRPGRSNALGELKIMFPNRHAIYMHDTPDRHLFSRENRALSNGCIRLEDPRGMAAAVLGWDRERIDARLTQPHSRQNLDVKVPVYVAYFTAWPQQDGTVAYFNDVYGRDGHIRDAIGRIETVRAPSG